MRETCGQPAHRAPLPIELVDFLPTIGRPNAIEDASALLEEGTVSLSGRPPFELPAEPSWREDPYRDPSWVYEYQSLFFILDALVAYRSTDDSRYLDLVQKHLEVWLAVHLPASFEANWGDHVMANRTRILLLAWEMLRERAPSAQTADGICLALQRHATHLMNESEYTARHNHGYFQDEALLALAVAFEDHPESRLWLERARERLAAQIEYAVTPEGVHREHSPSYHAGMQLRFATLASLLNTLGIQLRIDAERVVRGMYEFIAHGVLPTGRAPLVGDSSSWFGSANMPGITSEALYSLSRGQQGAPSAVLDRVFFDSGYAFFRDAWHSSESFAQTVYVGFVAGAFSRTHKHCDDLSVLLHGYGESWLVDIGFWSYDPLDLYASLARSPAGHNVVEVDHRSYMDAYPNERDVDSALHLLTDVELGPDASMVSGEHALNSGVTFRRTLQYTRPARLQVSDVLVADDGQEHDYVLYWHLAPDKVVTPTAGGASYRVTTSDPLGPTMELVVVGSHNPQCQIILAADDPYQGWYFPGFLQAEPAPVIACEQRASDATFTTRIELLPGT